MGMQASRDVPGCLAGKWNGPRRTVRARLVFLRELSLRVQYIGRIHVGAVLAPAGHWMVYISRVFEKSGLYTISIMWDLMAKLKERGWLQNVQWLQIWSDTGTHFRSYEVLSTYGYDFIDVYRFNIGINFGAEEHLKGRVDGHFSDLGNRKRRAATKATIKTISSLCMVYTSRHLEMIKLNPSLPTEEYIEFLPPARSTIRHSRFRISSLPGRIMTNYYWSFVYNNRRRTNLCGTGVDHLKVTAVFVRAHGLSGLAAGNAKKVRPYLMPKDAEDPDAANEYEKPAIDAEGDLQHKTKDYLGWRISYQPHDPTVLCTTTFARKIRRKMNGMQDVLDKLPEAKRMYRTGDAVREVHTATVAKQAAKQKLINDLSGDSEILRERSSFFLIRSRVVIWTRFESVGCLQTP